MERARIIVKGDTTEQSSGVCLSAAPSHVQRLSFGSL